MQCMNIGIINLNDLSIILNSLFILSQFSKAISPIIKCFDIPSWSSEFQFFRIVLNSFIKSFQFPVDKPPIRINNRIALIILNSFIKIIHCFIQHSHVSKATSSVMPIHSILSIKLNCIREVFDCLIEIEETVPDKASSVV